MAIYLTIEPRVCNDCKSAPNAIAEAMLYAHRSVGRPFALSPYAFWTADGYTHRESGLVIPCEEALTWYDDERRVSEWIDLGGEG